MKFKEAEFWRDVESLGSFIFYVAVMARSLIGNHWMFFTQLIVALIASQLILRVIGKALKQKISSHASNAGALLVLINVFYHSVGFLIFSIVLYLLAIIGHKRIRKHSWGEVLTGMFIGIIIALLTLFIQF